MANLNSSILYFLSDFYKQAKQKSVTIYRDDNGYVNLVVKNKYNKIVKRKKLRLIGSSTLDIPIWRANIEIANADQKYVDAYFDRKSKKRRKGGKSRKYKQRFSKEHNRKQGLKVKKLLFGG